MFKTILKTLALSATALTLLSACGTLADLDALIRDYEARSDASGAGTALAADLPDCYYIHDNDQDCNLDQRFCRDCPLSGEELLTFKARFIEARAQDILVHEGALRANAARLEGDERIRAEASIADLVASEKARVAGSAAARFESEIIKASLSEEQTRWQRLELWNVKYEPATTAPHAVAVSVASVTPTEDDTPHDFAVTKNPATFSLVLEIDDTAIATINGVDYEVLLNPANYRGAWYSSDPNRKVRNNWAWFLSSAASANIRRVVYGTHPTVQGDYFEYRAETEYTDDSSDYDSNNHIAGFATMGIETTAAVVGSQSAVAIYRGVGRLHSYKALGLPYYDTDVSLAITMSVDFDANTTQGTGRATYYDSDYYEYSPANVIFNSAPIVGNGFSGTFTLNSEMRELYKLNDNPTGQYSGSFFGPNADDLAGVMSFDGTASQYVNGSGKVITGDVDVLGIGGFRADRTVIPGFEE